MKYSKKYYQSKNKKKMNFNKKKKLKNLKILNIHSIITQNLKQ